MLKSKKVVVLSWFSVCTYFYYEKNDIMKFSLGATWHFLLQGGAVGFKLSKVVGLVLYQLLTLFSFFQVHCWRWNAVVFKARRPSPFHWRWRFLHQNGRGELLYEDGRRRWWFLWSWSPLKDHLLNGLKLNFF